jgi:hypothetical protein
MAPSSRRSFMRSYSETGGPQRTTSHMHSILPFKFFERAEYLLTAGRRLCTLEHDHHMFWLYPRAQSIHDPASQIASSFLMRFGLMTCIFHALLRSPCRGKRSSCPRHPRPPSGAKHARHIPAQSRRARSGTRARRRRPYSHTVFPAHHHVSRRAARFQCVRTSYGETGVLTRLGSPRPRPLPRRAPPARYAPVCTPASCVSDAEMGRRSARAAQHARGGRGATDEQHEPGLADHADREDGLEPALAGDAREQGGCVVPAFSRTEGGRLMAGCRVCALVPGQDRELGAPGLDVAHDVRCAPPLPRGRGMLTRARRRARVLRGGDDAHGRGAVRPGPARRRVPREPAPERHHDRRGHADEQDGARAPQGVRPDARAACVPPS